jgi:hypothetical protein
MENPSRERGSCFHADARPTSGSSAVAKVESVL